MCDNELRYGGVPHRTRSRRRPLVTIGSVFHNCTINRFASDSGESSGSYSNISCSTTTSRNFSSVTINRRKRRITSESFSDTDSSSDESFIGSLPKKRKIPQILSTDSSSSSDSDSDIFPFPTKRRATLILSDMSSSSSSSSDSYNMPSSSRRRPPTRFISDDDTDDVDTTVADNRSSSGSPIAARNPRVPRLVSSDEQGSSASSSSSDGSGDDSNIEPPTNTQRNASKKNRITSDNDTSSSSDYDNQAECCPICFRKLKSQEVGTPESCDHTFCVACLKEWAKNVNTCPVDRQKFSLILVRKAPGGKITDKIPIENVDTENNAANDEDPTFCEICGQNDREDRMMLCDGCDHGYHLECLTPPLHDIPVGEWFCPNCTWVYALGDHIEEMNWDNGFLEGPRTRRRRVHYLRAARESANEESESGDEWGLRSSLRQIRRLIPRTRQSQRIMNSLMNSSDFNVEPSADESDHDYEDVPDNTDVPTPTVSQPSRRKQNPIRRPIKRRRKTKRRRKNCRFKIKLITTEEGVIEVKLPKKKKRRYRKKKRTRRSTGGDSQGRVRVLQKKTVKERLARRLGIMCNNRRNSTQNTTGQSELQAMGQSHSSSAFREVIPTLDLFGARDQLDYFSGASDEDDMNIGGSNDFGPQLLSQRRQHSSLTSDLRVMSRKKAAAVLSRPQPQARSATSRKKSAASSTSTTQQASGPSLLDSILDSQTKWHSKDSEIIHNTTDGSLTVKVKEKKVDVNKENAKVTETPLYPGSTNPHGSRFSTYDYQSRDRTVSGTNRSTELHSSSGSSSSSFPSSNLSSFPSTRAGFSSNYGMGISPFTGAAPIRFRMNLPPRRPNIHSNLVVPPLRQPPFPDPQLFAQDPSPSNSPNEDEEVDIYSDIEPERTDNDGDDRNYGTLEPPPEPPALLMGLGQDDIDEENDEGGLVIDDQPLPPTQQLPPPPPPPADVYDPAEPCDDSNSSDADYQDEKKHPNYGMFPTVGPIPEITSSSKSLRSDEEDDEPNGDEADCPNFSMYSAASMNLARKNDEMQVKKNILLSNDDLDDDSLPSNDDVDGNKIDDVPLPPMDKSSRNTNSDASKIEYDQLSEKSVDRDTCIDSESFAKGGKTCKASSALEDDNENTLDIPIPEDLKEEDIPIPADINNEDIPVPENNDTKDELLEATKKLALDTADKKKEDEDDNNEEDDDDVDDEEEDDDDEEDVEDDDYDKDDNHQNESVDKNISSEKVEQVKVKTVVSKTGAAKDTDEGEDECSTQDVLDLAIGSEGNLQDNLNNDENEEPSISIHVENPEELEEGIEKVPDAGEKPDGLVDITDEEMSVYDGQDNLEKLSDNDKEHGMNDSQKDIDMFDSDDNSLVGGATSAVSAGTLNNSDNQQISTLPGLEGLETETISESEDVNFDELPEGNQNEERSIQNEEEYSSSKRKKKKKGRKTTSMSETEDASGKGQLDVLEFEEGEIIEDKPKQLSKKDKKSKAKHDKEVGEKDEVSAVPPVGTTPQVNKEPLVIDKKQKKKKDKKDTPKDKSVVSGVSSKTKEPKIKEKTVKPGEVDENIAWKKPSKSTKERNYRDGKDKEKDDNKKQEPAKREKKTKEKRKELERYDVRRLISEKPKQPRKDEFGRDLSPSKSRSLTPPRYRNRSPLRVRNRSRSRSWRSRSRSRGRMRRSRSRGRFRSRSRDRGRSRSRERARRSRSRRRTRSKERRRTKSKEKVPPKGKKRNRTISRTRRRTKSRSLQRSNRRQTRSYSQSWSPSWSRSSVSRSRSASPHTGRTRSLSRSLSRSWSHGHERHDSLVDVGHKNTRKNLTVIVPNKDVVRKKDKKKTTKKKDDKRKRRRGQSPAPSKEVFTSGDNILVSVNFKSNRGAAEIVPATTPVLRESSKRKRDDIDPITGKRKKDKSSKENVPLRNRSGQKGINKSNRLNKINEITKNAKPVAVIDLDLSPFREQTPSPKEVIILSDSGEENDKQQKEMEKQLERLGEGMVSGRLSMDTDHQQNTSISQPESPSTHSFMMTSTGPKTPPEPHVKFSIVSNKPQLRVLTNPLMECDEELRRDEATETDMDEVMHKGPNTPPEPPPDLNTPASPPTTPYDPFDPTKSRSPSPQPASDSGMQVSSSREEKSAESSSNLQGETDEALGGRIIEHRTLTPPVDSDELKKTPEPLKVLSTPKLDQSGVEISPKHQSPGSLGVEPSKIIDDSLLKPFQKLLSSASKMDVSAHKSPDKLLNVSNMSQQQIKNLTQTPTKQVGVIKKPAGLLPVYTPSMTLNSNKVVRAQQNGGTGDPSDDVLDLDAGSPYSPGSSEGDDLFDPPPMTPPRTSKPLPTSTSKATQAKGTAPAPSTQNKFDLLFSASPMKLPVRHGKHHGAGKAAKKGAGKGKGKGGAGKKEVGVKLDEDQLKILDDLPSSAVEMQFLKKLNRQERVVEEVKLVLKPHYAKKHISKEDYKEILRRAVPKICHNKSGEINPIKIQFLIEAYVRKFRKLGASKKKPAAVNQNAVPAKQKMQKTMWS